MERKQVGANISSKINSNQPVLISFKYADDKLFMFINSILSKFLEKTNQLYILNPLVAVMREVLFNAIKANAKRIFFTKTNLNINSSDDYEKGMQNFKKLVITNKHELEKMLTNEDYTVDLKFMTSEDSLIIKIVNNVPILPHENERIQFRLKQSSDCTSLIDIYSQIEDTTEGAGLGLAMVSITLKNVGLNQSHFQISNDETHTTCLLKIPKKIRPQSVTTNFKSMLLNEVKTIPTFPEYIMEIMALCDSKTSSMNDISGRIMDDPVLTLEVIKLSNSAAFVPGKVIDNIHDAVRIIGLKNVKSILIACTARKILKDKYSAFEEVWEHCNKVAFYAREISLKLNMEHLEDQALVSGLLHDLGKIILLSIDKKQIEVIAHDFKGRNLIDSTLMEEAVLGISHSEIGAVVSQNWGLPDFLNESIQFHHGPLRATETNLDLVAVIYLANMFCGIERNDYNYYFLSENILERFNFSDDKKFLSFHKDIKKSYEDHIKMVSKIK